MLIFDLISFPSRPFFEAQRFAGCTHTHTHTHLKKRCLQSKNVVLIMFDGFLSFLQPKKNIFHHCSAPNDPPAMYCSMHILHCHSSQGSGKGCRWCGKGILLLRFIITMTMSFVEVIDSVETHQKQSNPENVGIVGPFLEPG